MDSIESQDPFILLSRFETRVCTYVDESNPEGMKAKKVFFK